MDPIKKNSLMKRLCCFLFFLEFFSGQAFSEQSPHIQLNRYSETRYVMGTLLEITIYTSKEHADSILDGCFAIADKLELVLSNYNQKSEISFFNQSNIELQKVSSELFNFLKAAKELSHLSKGLFDPTVRPLIELWRESQVSSISPGQSMIDNTINKVGMHRIFLFPDNKVFKRKGFTIDTDGVGKGYAVDRIADYLKENGVASALINFGRSSIYAAESPPGVLGWRVLLGFSKDPKPIAEMLLKNQAFTVSESFAKTFRIGGKEYGHIINPISGLPLDEPREVAVVSDLATKGEALTKYLLFADGESLPDLSNWGKVEVWLRYSNGRIVQSLGSHSSEEKASTSRNRN